MSPIDALLRPSSYFRDHPHPLAGGVAVFALHVVGLLLTFVAVVHLLFASVEELPSGVWSQVFSVFVPLALFVLLAAAVSLAVVAAVMHLGAGGRRTDGSYADAVGVAGWAYAPEIVSYPVTYVHAWWRLRSFTYTGSDPAAFAAQVEAYIEPTDAFGIGLSIVVVAWSVSVLAAGTAATHDVDLDRAIGPAILVGIVSLGFRIAG